MSADPVNSSDEDCPQFSALPRHAMDADLTLYWPWVRPCWEDES